MQLSNDGVAYDPPEPYGTSKAWTLPDGDGPKTVYVRFVDDSGNWSGPVSATIELDTTPALIGFTSPVDGAVLTAP